MAIAFDAFVGATAGSDSPYTWTHTPVGTPRGVLVFTEGLNITGAATYGGVAMTYLRSPSKGTGESSQIACWALTSNIPTGPQTVSVGTVSGAHRGWSISFTALGNTLVVDHDEIVSDSIENPSVALQLNDKRSYCVITFFSGIGDVAQITPFTNWTVAAENDLGTTTVGVYLYDIIGAADVSAGWTQSADDAIAVAVAMTDVVRISRGMIFG